MATKKYLEQNVLSATKERIARIFDNFETYYISFSGGKDSTVMMHLVMQEAIKRGKRVGVLIIDLEAQYKNTIEHLQNMVNMYNEYIDLHWFCGELLLRNAVSDFQPKWVCWDEDNKSIWVREKPKQASDLSQYDFYIPKMEFEEFMILFGKWYSKGKLTAGFIGIRADESLHRYKAITATKKNLVYNGWKWTTKIDNNLYNTYPIYDWRTEDIWVFHSKYKELPHNKIYDLMTMAGVKLSNQRLCQPYGDDQKKGLWLYHILEPETWYKLLNRVSGVNSGSLYIQEHGNINGYNDITKPENHTWQSYTNYLLKSLPLKMQNHYRERFKKFIVGWKKRGYVTIPDKAPHDLEIKSWAPSWKRMARCILRNDFYCKGLGQTQPKSEAYLKYKEIKFKRKIADQISNEEVFEPIIEDDMTRQIKLF